MPCGKMRWKKAMSIARREYPGMSLKRRKKVAAAIVGKRKKRKRR